MCLWRSFPLFYFVSQISQLSLLSSLHILDIFVFLSLDVLEHMCFYSNLSIVPHGETDEGEDQMVNDEGEIICLMNHSYYTGGHSVQN